jgi:hypothetical protein
MNTKLIESLVQIIQTLSEDEQLLIKAKLFNNIPYPSTVEITQLAQSGGAFQFLTTNLIFTPLKMESQFSEAKKRRYCFS